MLVDGDAVDVHDYLRVIHSLDRNIGRVIDYLRENNLLDNTMIVYTSDQGFYMGLPHNTPPSAGYVLFVLERESNFFRNRCSHGEKMSVSFYSSEFLFKFANCKHFNRQQSTINDRK